MNTDIIMKALCYVFSFFQLLAVSSAKNLQYFAQITDTHIDMDFASDTADNCLLHKTGMPCCRKNQIDRKPFTITTKWGVQSCDTSPYLFQTSVSWMKNNLPELDFIINTGDSADHHLLFQSRDGNLKAITFVQDVLRSVFPRTPILNVLGNHDAFPIDQTITQHFMYPQIASSWNLTDNQSDTFIRGGFYRHDISEKLTVFVINSVFFDQWNIESKYLSQQDFRGQFEWIEAQLQECHDEGRTVWFLNHEPPRSRNSDGKYDWYTQKLIEVANVHNIEYQFFGHEHYDRFVLYGKRVGFITPSFLPADHNPSFRLYEYNGTHISDYIQYYANLTTAISSDDLHFEPLYRFSHVFGGAPTYVTYTNYFESLQTNSTLYDEFCSHYWVGGTQSCGDKASFIQRLQI